MVSEFSIYNKRIKCYNTLENRILGAYRCLRGMRKWKGNGVRISDRTAAVKWSCRQMPLAKAGKAFAALKLSQKTCLLSVYRILRTKEWYDPSNIGLIFEQDMIGRRSQSVLFFVSPCRKSPAAGRENPTIEYQSFQCQAEFHRRGKRESGENPGRSGHCKRGDGLQCHCAMHEKAQPRSMIREPGNLLKILCIASGESVLQL